MPARLRRLCGLICWRLRVPAFMLLSAIIGAGIAVAVIRLTTWPYYVVDRQMVGENTSSKDRLVQYRPGDRIVMQRKIEYHDLDCWRQYDRRIVSDVETGPLPGYIKRFPPFVEQRLPGELSGRWSTWTDELPDDFPCGPARLVETITAACNWFHRYVRYLHKPDVITPFEVVGCAPG